MSEIYGEEFVEVIDLPVFQLASHPGEFCVVHSPHDGVIIRGGYCSDRDHAVKAAWEIFKNSNGTIPAWVERKSQPGESD